MMGAESVARYNTPSWRTGIVLHKAQSEESALAMEPSYLAMQVAYHRSGRERRMTKFDTRRR